MAYRAYEEQGLEVDFENDETLFRFYDSEADMWYNAAIKLPPAPFIQPNLPITDDVLIKKKKRNRAKLGFALTYIPIPIQENKNRRPQMAILTDINSGGIIDQTIGIEQDKLGMAIIELFTRYIENHGRPMSIAVSGEDASDLQNPKKLHQTRMVARFDGVYIVHNLAK